MGGRERLAEVSEQFKRDVQEHALTILRDDGLYRHLRFKRPGTMTCYFDLVTWPGHLAYVGDMGDYVFTRVEDMLTFFRGHTPSPGYWAEKCVAVDKNSGLNAFSQDVFKASIEEDLQSHIAGYYAPPDDVDGDGEVIEETDEARTAREEAIQELRDAVDDDVFERLGDDRDGRSAVSAAMDVEDSKGRCPFSTIYESDFTEWTFRFLWCCHALPWAIAQYDAEKAKVTT